MKLRQTGRHRDAGWMPPTRGHDLKPFRALSSSTAAMMPPTRGHDLKP